MSWMSWNFVRFHKIIFQTDAESFSFVSWKAFLSQFSVTIWNRISWNLTKFQLIQLIQTIFISNFSIGCLIELKFCEVSRNAALIFSDSFAWDIQDPFIGLAIHCYHAGYKSLSVPTGPLPLMPSSYWAFFCVCYLGWQQKATSSWRSATSLFQ